MKLTGSNIKLLTPVPTDMTTIVALPYRAYPAAMTLRPDCRQSLTVAGPSLTCRQPAHTHVHSLTHPPSAIIHDHSHSLSEQICDIYLYYR